MDDIEVPQYFVCPISLQIMRDPVTAITGITYDRDSIEHWLFQSKNTTCPVTKQPLPRDSELTPNHTLRRLIQAWCTENASYGIDRIPTPKPPLDKAQVLKLLKDFWNPKLQLKIIRKIEFLATKSEGNRKYLVDAGVAKAMLLFIANRCYKEGLVDGLEEALSVLHFVRISSEELSLLFMENDQIIDSLTWVFGCKLQNQISVSTHAVLVLKSIIQKANSIVLETLNPDFFKKLVGVLRNGVTQQGTNAALHIMLDACPWGRNRIKMVDAGAVYELIELEFEAPEKKTTELIFGILFHLCSCADGRAQFVSHKGGIFVVSNRLLKVSPSADDRVVLILSLICKYSGTNMVLQEMLEVGAVYRLCTLLQVDCAPYLKDKARQILRSHYEEWKKCPCLGISFHPR
ncbi:hypothetical protein L3X38_038543 [Prunus dulcis]|uniref:U-box domain-containing protein n=1 Tax=Prunus dulcis TaxID=3755 RepID=A0AAD4YRM0_PRUDU|nr:hypothetical protein L3X38_038543 [Prunus dulcis]